jgi:hypothetical protein
MFCGNVFVFLIEFQNSDLTSIFLWNVFDVFAKGLVISETTAGTGIREVFRSERFVSVFWAFETAENVGEVWFWELTLSWLAGDTFCEVSLSSVVGSLVTVKLRWASTFLSGIFSICAEVLLFKLLTADGFWTDDGSWTVGWFGTVDWDLDLICKTGFWKNYNNGEIIFWGI